MKEANRIDITFIALSVIIMLIPFFLTGYYNSYIIQHMEEFSFWDILDIYSLILIPVAILFFLLGKLRLSFTTSYIFILFQFNLFHFLFWEFQENIFINLIFITFITLYIIGVYVFSNQINLLNTKFANKIYFKVGFCIFVLVALFITSIDDSESVISKLVFGFIFAVSILYPLHDRKKWILYYLALSFVSIILLTFYLSCYSHIYGDIGLIDFSIKSICDNCLKNYLWAISGLTILYMTINKINTTPNST